jgi:AraC-like DNA-binding protein
MLSAERRMLERERVLETKDMSVDDVRCRHEPSTWSEPEVGSWYGVVMVREGTFRRAADGTEHLLDPASLYFDRPGIEQRVAHPTGGGDRCTAIRVGEELLAAVWGGEPGMPDGARPSSPGTDLAGRRLLVAARSDPFDASERVVGLIAALLAEADPPRVSASRPSTDRARRRIVDEAREVVALEPTVGLVELAGRVACSTHHLSRIFRAGTGETISRYRNRVRVRMALERLAEGEASLSALAADLGFADASHLARTVRAETGGTPSWLRDELAGSIRN